MDLLVAVELLSSAIKGVAKLLDRFVEVVNALVGDSKFGKVCIEGFACLFNFSEELLWGIEISVLPLLSGRGVTTLRSLLSTYTKSNRMITI